ncbi:putative ATP-dependent RNA helicase DDX52 [Triplophysa tibetana]|uniref:Putative ATP-dependent RNA helicase DDX52 n=1 Tax=Triplophysa tibetana TaxID=1572043 RepID=A0A5A9PH81_9TELE|nr:putative ATP-dependent RNA helicase DDX52 [Triplophysa tibetana]
MFVEESNSKLMMMGILGNQVEWLVVDESDKLFEDGKTGFREQLACNFTACSSLKIRLPFFSATCSPDLDQWCRLNLDNLVSVNIGPSTWCIRPPCYSSHDLRTEPPMISGLSYIS